MIRDAAWQWRRPATTKNDERPIASDVNKTLGLKTKNMTETLTLKTRIRPRHRIANIRATFMSIVQKFTIYIIYGIYVANKLHVMMRYSGRLSNLKKMAW